MYVDGTTIALGASLLANIILAGMCWMASNEARHTFNQWALAAFELSHWHKYGMLRDPQTGRIKKKEPEQ